MDPAEKTSSSKVILSIIVILVIAAIAFAMVRSNGTDDMATTTNATSSDTAAPEAFSGSLFDLAARSGDWRCTWSSEQDGVQLNGTTFVSGGKFRSNVAMTGVGTNMNSYAIGDGVSVYSWTDATAQGVKFPAQPAAIEGSGSDTQSLQFTGSYTYDCDPWIADASQFVPPASVTFVEVADVN